MCIVGKFAKCLHCVIVEFVSLVFGGCHAHQEECGREFDEMAARCEGYSQSPSRPKGFVIYKITSS